MNVLNLDGLLTKFGESLRGSHNYFIPVAKQFFKAGMGHLDRESVERYVKVLEDAGYAPGTIDRNWRVVRRLFKVAEVPWPFSSGEGPKIPERSVYAPALESELVRQMIKAACNGKMSREATVFLALSTTYGLRRAEMTGLEAKDVDLDGRTIYIETAKGGRQRYHIIPDELIPVLQGYHWPEITAYQGSALWWEAEVKAGIPRLEEVGWHSIRRMLVRSLMDAGMIQPAVESFLRWKRSEKEMAKRYYNTTVVGAGGRGIALASPDRQVDEQAFALHPWLKLWGDVRR